MCFLFFPPTAQHARQSFNVLFSLSLKLKVRGQENGLDGGKAGLAGRGAERGRRGRGRGRGALG